ncbi:helix-turn-helix domain-containing protein [Actinoplanes regularis]|uniref:Transcriptional regulator, AraC family n=1 Tax=Actinoplanes regularis TaxID=52697 RepID=A0A239J044_9ACTN|nr:helix-turn-helix domain-containing protein [Actinoplanes regularis]GIE91923.1 AraC family transcriptional regulator [Actinoplanes regularis]SNS99416.1 transcriptional regulator, AraC family [Actinoplanes regularis]
MSYVEWAPPESLRGAVACLWRSTVPQRVSRMPILPDGCVDLIWQSGHGAFLAGPDTGPVPDEVPSGRTLVGVRLRPGAGGTVLGMPLEPLRNLRPGLAALRPETAGRLPGDLTPAEALGRLVTLTGRLSEERPPDPAMLEAARLLRDPHLRVRELGGRLGLGDRQLRRRFTAAVGYGPKTLHRVFRFRRFLSLLTEGTGPHSIGELAVRAGYVDQAHLSRETVEFAGLPPAALARRLSTSSKVSG